METPEVSLQLHHSDFSQTCSSHSQLLLEQVNDIMTCASFLSLGYLDTTTASDGSGLSVSYAKTTLVSTVALVPRDQSGSPQTALMSYFPT